MKEFMNGNVEFGIDELNLLSLFARAASEYYESKGADFLSKEAKEVAHSLYVICEKHGLYENL